LRDESQGGGDGAALRDTAHDEFLRPGAATAGQRAGVSEHRRRRDPVAGGARGQGGAAEGGVGASGGGAHGSADGRHRGGGGPDGEAERGGILRETPAQFVREEFG